jgi:aarF domain-containing kinase
MEYINGFHIDEVDKLRAIGVNTK